MVLSKLLNNHKKMKLSADFVFHPESAKVWLELGPEQPEWTESRPRIFHRGIPFDPRPILERSSQNSTELTAMNSI